MGRSVHAGGEGVGGVAEADNAGSPLDVAGEGDVLEDGSSKGAVAADREVGVAFDEDELSVGGGDAAGGVVDLLHGVDAGELGEDEGHDGVLPEACDDLAR